ncbi:PAS domain S-box protein [Salinadaptatus halalkaliphilus]|uniref:histidine kinase n=1 Tax=Salinadaptatus halalkaliphilus TaxID=2419781 RepID=A0A4S3TS29_9EURY|nr:PAS domain S-box protein [Salinadaptatus halalkaliphilus]THE65418.1 PAS domain S-box protein [Salinadaptatus halalkaliphilus]
MAGSTRVLYVGDDLATERGLDDCRREPTVTSLADPAAAIDRLASDDIDCVVCDAAFDEAVEMDGLDLLRTIRDRDPSLPVILVTDGSPEQTTAAIAAGVTDLHTTTSPDTATPTLASRVDVAVDSAGTAVDSVAGESTTPVGASDDGIATTETDSFQLVELFTDIDRYRPVIDGIADPVYVLDDEGVCIAANRAWSAYTGHDRSVFVGRHAREFLDEQEYETASATVANLYAEDGGRDAFEMTIETATGETRRVEVNVTVVTDETGAYAGSIGVMRDITERKARTRELGQYEAIVETAPIGLLAVDADGYLRWHNEVFTEDLGIDREIVGTHFTEIVDDGFVPEMVLDNYLDRVRHLLSDENDDERVTYETEWVDANGDRGVTEFNMGLLPLEDGEFAGTVHAFRNVTERVEYHAELERQNDRLEQFASIVSHDIRNPLNVASGYLDILEAEHDDDELEEIQWALERMEELIDDLLTLARYGRTVDERERVVLDEVLAESWAGVDTADATLVAAIDGSIIAHESRIRELFENLFRNAIEHGGLDVTVTVGRIDGEADGFFVEDDGGGLPDTEDIFEFGHTTAEDGTGFGLGIVSDIASAHGWSITACQGASGGARFEVREVTSLSEHPN